MSPSGDPEHDLIVNPFSEIIYAPHLQRVEKRGMIMTKLHEGGPAMLQTYLDFKELLRGKAQKLLGEVEESDAPLTGKMEEMFTRAGDMTSGDSASGLTKEFADFSSRLSRATRTATINGLPIDELGFIFGQLAVIENESNIAALQPESPKSTDTSVELLTSGNVRLLEMKSAHLQREQTFATTAERLLNARIAFEQATARLILNAVLDKGAVTVADTEAPATARFKKQHVAP